MRDKPQKPNSFADAPTAIAEQFGISAKALRVYEELGLIRPARTQAGWRAYGPQEVERVAIIVALKQLGLPLKRIKAIMSGNVSMDSTLALQEAALEETQQQTQEALRLVRSARARLASHQVLSPEELATLVRSTKMSDSKWTAKLEAVAAKHYTPEQLAQIKSRPFTAADQARVGDAWLKIWADIDALGDAPSVTSEAALAIGRRAKALIDEFTQGDPSLFRAAGAMNSELMQDPEAARQMKTTQTHWMFLGAVMKELQAREA